MATGRLRGWLGTGCFVLVGLGAPEFASAQTAVPPDAFQTAAETAEALSPLAMLAPLGISPFLALGLLGVGASHAELVLPPSLAFVAHPALWIGLLAMAVLLKVGRSFKLTKPLVEVAGTTESMVAILALLAMFMTPAMTAGQSPEMLEAGLFGSALMVVGAVSGLLMVIVVRMGFDLLTWLSPIPLIDALLQFAKFVATAVLVAVAVFLPALAVALNVAVLVLAVLAGRMLIRLGRFAARVLWDGVAGRLRPATVTVGGGSVGPLQVFAIRSECGLPRLGLVEVYWDSGGWAAVSRKRDRAPEPLGESSQSTFRRCLIGTTLSTPRARLFLTPRYHRGLERVAQATGTPLVRKARTDSPAVEVRTV